MKPSITYNAGHANVHMYKSKKAKDFQKMFQLHLKRLVDSANWDIDNTIDAHFYLDVKIVLPRTNADDHNYDKILLDSMEGIIYHNDCTIHPRHQRVFYGDNNKTGFVLSLIPVEWIGLFNNQKEHDKQRQKCIKCRFYQAGKCSVFKKILQGRLNDDFDFKSQSCTKYVQKKAGKKNGK